MTGRFTELTVDCQGPDRSWVVMADPEGNEFDVLRTLAPQDDQPSGLDVEWVEQHPAGPRPG